LGESLVRTCPEFFLNIAFLMGQSKPVAIIGRGAYVQICCFITLAFCFVLSILLCSRNYNIYISKICLIATSLFLCPLFGQARKN
jgi:hypothetical protein